MPTTDVADLVEAVPLGGGAKQKAIDLLAGADRFYHGIDHVALLWRRHREYAQDAGFADARQSRLVACAILFHDCVYDAARTDNEACSAAAWQEASAASSLDADERAWVAASILATRDHLADRAGSMHEGPEALRAWFLDLDLSPLGETPALFDRNLTQLRAESEHLSDIAFEATQVRSLRRFAAAPSIYRSPVLAARFETAAQHNLRRHLRRADRRQRFSDIGPAPRDGRHRVTHTHGLSASASTVRDCRSSAPP